MIYWPITPGTEFDIAFPLLSPLSEAEMQEGRLMFTMKNDVGRWEIDGSDWDWYASPAWIRVPVTIPDPVTPGQNWPPEGEYTYEAFIEVVAPDHPEDYSNRLLSKGIAIFGAYSQPQPGQYEQEITYQQYGQEIND